ncbi:MAG: VWA domain-containing protein [Clostridia bacterium]|nr:VWA domain-containing protein [Clostridia bacterium]
MINISFDNTYLLLLAIPLLTLVIVPYCIAIRKANRTKGVVASLILHIVIVLFMSFGVAGTKVTATLTKTEVFVVADVSYSANGNLDTVDEHVRAVSDALPQNSEMGVVVFGRDCQINTSMGGGFSTVKDFTVDNTATDIKGALEYTASLFSESAVKRIVLISDGKQTDAEGANGIVSTVESLRKDGIYIDAIYIDNNLGENVEEVQVTSVEYNAFTYENNIESVSVLLQSNQSQVNATVTLYREDEVIGVLYPTLEAGYTSVEFPLPTQIPQTLDGEESATEKNKSISVNYRVEVRAENYAGEVADELADNNVCSFVQTVACHKHVLVLTGTSNLDMQMQILLDMYGEDTSTEGVNGVYEGEKTTFNVYLQQVNATYNVPTAIDELMEYDEIILADVDVSNEKFNNRKLFLSNLDMVVANYGKSLITIGDNKIQNATDDNLKALEDMLPVKYGNRDQSARTTVIVLDSSRSLMYTGGLDALAKNTAVQMLDLLGDDEYVSVVAFWGDHSTITGLAPVKVGENREKIIEKISSIQMMQGTVISAAMQEAYDILTTSNVAKQTINRQVILISDGKTWDYAGQDPVTIAADMKTSGIHVWSIFLGLDTNGYARMNKIATSGNFLRMENFFQIKSPSEAAGVLLGKAANSLTDSIISNGTKNSPKLQVKVSAYRDEVLNGLGEEQGYENGSEFTRVSEYVYTRAKSSATTVLYADYEMEYILPSGEKAEEPMVIQNPIYAYWNYGQGKVSTLTVKITGNTTYKWRAEETFAPFMKNIEKTNMPQQKTDVPFTDSVDYDGRFLKFDVTPAELTYDAMATATIVSPSGKTETIQLIFDSQRYIYNYETAETGRYDITISYMPTGKEEIKREKQVAYILDYTPEYNRFTGYNVSDLHKAIRSHGNIYTDGDIELINDESDVAISTFDCTIPLMIAAVVLFVFDIMVRKLRWVDIKNFFGNKDKKKTGVRK